MYPNASTIEKKKTTKLYFLFTVSEMYTRKKGKLKEISFIHFYFLLLAISQWGRTYTLSKLKMMIQNIIFASLNHVFRTSLELPFYLIDRISAVLISYLFKKERCQIDVTECI